jgi:diguanylate cyclase (GGDEF)-like protein
MHQLNLNPRKRLDPLWFYVLLLLGLLTGYTFYISYASINHYLHEEIEDETHRLATFLGAQFKSPVDERLEVQYQLLEKLDQLRAEMGIFKVKFYNAQGVVVFSSDPHDIGQVNDNELFIEQVMKGKTTSELEQATMHDEQGLEITHEVIESYYPYMDGHRFLGAFEIYFDVTQKHQQLLSHTRWLYSYFLLGTGLMVALIVILIRRSHRAALVHEQRHADNLREEIGKRAEVEAQLLVNERRFDFMAHHDDLTLLPNRRFYHEQLHLTVERAQRYDRRFGLLFLDLDNFKDVNDSLGHPVGDLLLKALVMRLQSVLRTGDFLARVGGDEFTLILEQVDSRETADIAAERIIEVLQEPFEVNGLPIKANASIGVCLYPDDGTSVNELTQHADIAMYEAKRQCKGNRQFYHQQLAHKTARQLQLQSELETVLERDELVLYYQPQIDLNADQLIGAEALVRWQHPQFGLVSPMEFIPLAERSDCIIKLGEWVMRTAINQITRWRNQYPSQLSVAINLSARQFRDPQLVQRIIQLMPIKQGEKPPLELELTESLLMDNTEQAMKTLQQCAQAGISVAIDDFGTGYSSLQYLQKFPATKLKIDRSFISNIQDPSSALIVDTIIGLAKNLGMKLVAEGAELQEQIDYLKQRDCDIVQGYFYSKPLPVDEFERRWLRHPASDDGEPEPLVVNQTP